jgi:hypothetical protein
MKKKNDEIEGVRKKMDRVGDVLLKVMKILPVIGWFFVIAAAPIVLKRKGLFFGTLSVALDCLPVICLIKAGIEVFTGDLIPNRFETPATQNFEVATL